MTKSEKSLNRPLRKRQISIDEVYLSEKNLLQEKAFYLYWRVN